MSLSQRIWKYKTHYFIVIPPLLMYFIFKVYPWLQGLYMSMLNFTPFEGFKSEWVGFRNYTAVWSDEQFVQGLINTLMIKLLYIFLCGALAFVLALALSRISSGRWRAFFASLFLLPYFIPGSVKVYVATWLLSQQRPWIGEGVMILGHSAGYQLTASVLETFSTSGIPILLALAAIAAAKSANGGDELQHASVYFSRLYTIPAARAIGAFLLLKLGFILTTDFNIAYSLSNPLTGRTFDVYSLNIGVMNMRIGESSAVMVIQFVIQLLFGILAYAVVRGKFLRDLFHAVPAPPFGRQQRLDGSGGIWGYVAAVLYSLIVASVLFVLFVLPYTGISLGGEMMSDAQPEWHFGKMLLYLIAIYFAAFFHTVMVAMLAYPFTVKNLPGRKLYKCILFALAFMGSSYFSEYMFYRAAGMVNTIFPIFLTGLFTVIPVFVLKSIFNSKYAALKEEAEASGKGELETFFTLFIAKLWKPLIAIAVLQFTFLWGSFLAPLLYLLDGWQYSPVMMIHALSNAGADPATVLKIGALASLPPIILFLVFRRWITSEVLLGELRK
ncbi:hypothetical protein [Paenibacillus sp. NPDC058071]|uniref:hypothetical protein n=1 Tax=Paenibacillus sp. NPDC058071 TaxID=3346326 RepID=UPI0036DCCBC8